MKIIFLDFDGVLNNIAQAVVRGERAYLACEIDKTALGLVRWCAESTGAKVVVSSTWRMQGKDWVKGVVEASGWDFPPIYDITPKLHGVRGEEIQKWINDQDEDVTYAIVDDDSDMLDSQLENFVQTDPALGFTLYDAVDVINILGCLDEHREDVDDIRQIVETQREKDERKSSKIHKQ